jgi:cytochrome P450
MAPTSLFEVIAGVGGSEAPFYLLGLAQTMGRNSFRIPLPLGMKGTYVIGDHELARQILLDKTTEKAVAIYKSADGCSLGTPGLFTSPNNEYMRNIRKSTAHAFSKKEVERMNTIAIQYVDEWLDTRLANYAKFQTTFDPAKELLRITFLMICDAAFEYTPTQQEIDDFNKHIEISLREFVLKQAVNPLRKVFGIFMPSVQKALRSSRLTLDFCAHILDVYHKNPNKSKQKTIVKLLAENKFLTRKETITNILGFVVAGQDVSFLIVVVREYCIVHSTFLSL